MKNVPFYDASEFVFSGAHKQSVASSCPDEHATAARLSQLFSSLFPKKVYSIWSFRRKGVPLQPLSGV